MLSNTEIVKKPFSQLLLILILCLGSTIIFSLIGVALGYLVYGLNISSVSNYANENVMGGLKLIQLLSAIGLFVVPPIVYAFLVSKKQPFVSLGLVSWKPIALIGLVFVLMFIITPFLSWLIEWNAQIEFPDFLYAIEEWMRRKELEAGEITNLFLNMDDTPQFMYIFFIIAIIPAVGEELLFRGVLQKILVSWTKNAHWGIWITAFLFSALHMQFYGFFPRMLLGGMFGYLFLWSKSLWLPIFAHFINNGSVVIASYFYQGSLDEAEILDFADSEYNYYFYTLSILLSLLVLIIIKKTSKPKSFVPLE